MTAIATDKLKFKYTDLLFNEIVNAGDTNHYYIGIGKSDQYDSANDTVINPTNTLLEEMNARHNIQSIVKVDETAMSFIVPRNNWTSGAKYNGWNDKQVGYPTDFPYYVLTEDQQVYICIQASRGIDGNINPSTVKPSYASHPKIKQAHAFKTSDGYIWKFLYEVTATRSNLFLTSGFLPTQIGDSAGNTSQQDQAIVEKATTKGQITGFEIIDGGAGYGSTPTVTITGNGTGAIATATRDPATNTISKIEMTCTLGDSGMGSGYTFARAALSSVSETRTAIIRPIFGPLKGFGADARQDLKSSSVVFNAKPTGDVSGAFSVSTGEGVSYGGQADYRQITLLRNLDYVDSAADGGRIVQAQGRASRMIVTTNRGNELLKRNEKLTGANGTVVWIDQIDAIQNKGADALAIHYHFNSRQDLKPGTFVNGEALTGSPSGGTANVDSDSQPGSTATVNKVSGTQIGGLGAIDKYSGDILYIDNRTRIIRSSTQTEDIKIILSV